MISKNEKKIIRSLEQKKYRKQHGLFVVEGWKSVSEFLKHYTPTLIISTEPLPSSTTSSKYLPSPISCRTEIVSEDELRSISFLQHPQQVIALFNLPESRQVESSVLQKEKSILQEDEPAPSLRLALDGVQDPGNLGTIIRIADWFGINEIICSLDTADAYNPKTVQATMGSLARVKVIYTDLPEWLRSLPHTTPIYGTLLDGENIYRQQLSPNGVIVMGNEGKGLSEEVRQLVTKKLLIPSFAKGDTAESLNVAVATAITCSEFLRNSPSTN